MSRASKALFLFVLPERTVPYSRSPFLSRRWLSSTPSISHFLLLRFRRCSLARLLVPAFSRALSFVPGLVLLFSPLFRRFPRVSRSAASIVLRPSRILLFQLHRLTLHSPSFRWVSSRFPFSFSCSLAQRAPSFQRSPSLARPLLPRALCPALEPARSVLSAGNQRDFHFFSLPSTTDPLGGAFGFPASRSRRRSSFVCLRPSSDPARCDALAPAQGILCGPVLLR